MLFLHWLHRQEITKHSQGALGAASVRRVRRCGVTGVWGCELRDDVREGRCRCEGVWGDRRGEGWARAGWCGVCGV